MPRTLKGRMPRTLPDHRSTLAKRIRRAYDDLAERFKPQDGVTRRVMLLTARAWVDYEDASARMAAARKPKGIEDNRLRRQQGKHAGYFLGGIRTLAGLAATNGQDLGALLGRGGEEP